MHAYHSFQSELCFGCLERKSGIVQSLSSASSQFRIADPQTGPVPSALALCALRGECVCLLCERD